MRQTAGLAAPCRARTGATTSSPSTACDWAVRGVPPAQMGYDSDSPVRGLGKVANGVSRTRCASCRRHPVDSVSHAALITDDMVPRCSCCSTSSSARRGGLVGIAVPGTVQTRSSPAAPRLPAQAVLRLVTDLFGYCKTTCAGGTPSPSPTWREAGADARAVGTTLSNGGMTSRPRSPPPGHRRVHARLGILCVGRAPRSWRRWRVPRRPADMGPRAPDEFQAKNPKSLTLRSHTQTAGCSSPSSSQRSTWSGWRFGAGRRAGRSPSRCTPKLIDEAIGLPTRGRPAGAAHPAGARVRDGCDRTVDPFAGSYAMEALTDELEAAARSLMTAVEDMDGAGRDRTGLPEDRDREVGVPDRPADVRQARDRRSQPIRGR